MSEHKHVSGIGYVFTFIGLIVLATVSLLISFLHWPVWGTVIALGIAVIKALLVAFFFMHLAEQRFTNRATVLVSVLFVSCTGKVAEKSEPASHWKPVLAPLTVLPE